jgi:predicted RNase H-like HicB family nuclease
MGFCLFILTGNSVLPALCKNPAGQIFFLAALRKRCVHFLIHRKKCRFKIMKLKDYIHKAEEGGYRAEVPAISGCVTQGETFEELLPNIYVAVEGRLGVDIEAPQNNNTQVLEIAV